jgi:DNA primase
MARYTPDAKEKVRDAVDFVALVSQYTDLRKAGPTRWTGLCPFHEERSPSFGIEPNQKLFKCFGCGEGGDVFRFVELKEGLDFRGALEFLADRSGIELELEAEDPEAAGRRRERDRLLELIDRTATFYARYLWDSGEARRAREYLGARGLEEAALREFRVGYAPRRWDSVLLASRRAGFSNAEVYAAGLAQRSKSTGRLLDRFRGRIMFPLADRRGRVLGFGARRLDDEDPGPKYLNSADSDLFHKGQNLYAADIARAHATKAGTVVLAEGYTDVIALHQAGLRNTVGLMGTALTPEQVAELARLAPVVALALDADSAGQEAMLRAAKVAAGRRLELRVVPLPPGADPADLVQAEGGAAMRALVDAAKPFVRFRVERELDRADLTTAEGKDRAIDALRPVFAALPPSAVRVELEQLVADRTELSPSLVSSWLARPASGGSGAGDGRPGGRETAGGPAAGAPGNGGGAPGGAAAGGRAAGAAGGTRSERAFLGQCVVNPSAARAAIDALDVEAAFTSDLHRRAAAHLREHAADPSAALPEGDEELASLVAGLVVRAAGQEPSRAALDVEGLKLQLASVERRMAVAREAGAGDVAALAHRRAELKTAVDQAIVRAMED